MKIGFVVNDIETEKAEYTTNRLAMAAKEMGHEAWYMGIGDFAYEPDGSLSTTGDDSVRCVLAGYPVADPLARYRFMGEHTSDPKFPNAPRLVESSLGYFGTEAMMAEASVTRVIEARQSRALPPAWVAQPDQDDNVPTEIPDALVAAWEKAGGHIERVRVPNAKHGFLGTESVETTKAIAGMRDFIGRYLIA